MTRSLQKEKSLAHIAFLLTLGMALLLFLPFVIYNRGYFIYYGDYNAQQISFYRLAHEAVRSGNIGWSWTTDLGANFIGSYSFYLLGSPFFWLTLLFPAAAVPYMLAPLLALKIALAGLTAYAYAQHFLRPRLAVLAGVLYAFSGFSLYNIFFNHFHEAMIWFPLLLLGIEQYMQEGRRGLFAVAVLMSALSNYYFFIGQAFFVMLYWIVRASAGEWQRLPRRFFGLWLQALIGIAGAAVLLLPSYYAVIQNSRVDAPLEGFGLLIYGSQQRLYDILHSFFFPPELPARANFFPDANNKWASMSAWIPVFGCTGVIAYFQSHRHTDWLRRMLTVLFFFAVIPGLNALFQLFNRIYYARWYYMLLLILILATLRCFEEEEADPPVNWRRAIGWSGGFTAAFILLIGLVPKSWKPDEETGKLTIGLESDPPVFWLYAAIAAACLLLTGLLVWLWRYRRQEFIGWCTVACVGVSLLFGWGYLSMGKYLSNYPDDYVIDKLIQSPGFTKTDDTVFYRTDMYKGMDNQGMYWGIPCIQAFHSIVPGPVMDFYNSIGVERTVASRPGTEVYAIRSLLSVRYLFDYAQLSGDVQLYYKEADDFFSVEGVTAMDGWKLIGTENGYNIYENENFIPMGFTYDGYITRSEYEELTEATRQLALLKALVVEDEDAQKISLPHLSTNAMWFIPSEYAQDCRSRAADAASSFATDNRGFSATISLSQAQPVFFSVPYENGWTATVNGQPVEILQANVGFMAVNCPAGEDVEIRFTYETPGLRTGALISAGGLLALLLYLLCSVPVNRRAHTTAAIAPQPLELPPLQPAAQEHPPVGPDEIDPFTIYQPNPTDTQTEKEE